jgi:protoheme IX farnesyltransferase
MSTVGEALFYAVAMIPVSLAPWRLGLAGWPYAVAALLLDGLYLGYTIRFTKILHAKNSVESRRVARDLLKVSVLFLPLLLITLMLDASWRH